MRFRSLLLLIVVLSLSAQAQDAGANKSAAAFVPARAAVYIEVRQPGATLKDLAGLLRGSCLDDYPAGMQRLRQQGDIHESLEFAGLLLTPEGLKEAQKFEGMAVAVLGPQAEGGDLEYVALLQPGESALPGLLMRRFLGGSEVQAAGEVEGVKLYRHTAYSLGGVNAQAARMQAAMMQQMRRLAQQGQIPRGQFQPCETDFALLPGLVVMGTPAAVKETVLLAKGKGSGPRLADDGTFQQASKAFGDKAGLFLYGNSKGLAAEIEKLEADKRPVWAQALQRLVNPASLPSTNGSVTLADGALQVRVTATVTEGAKSPLLEALPNVPFRTELLHFVPSNLEAVVGLSNAEGGKRWERILEMADSLVKAADANTRLPSRQVDRLEDDLKIKISQDVAAKVSQLVVAQGAQKPGATPPVLILLESTDEDAAKALVTDGLPKVLGALLGQRVVPTVKEVKGRALHVADLGSRGTFSFSRQGTVVAVSTDVELTSEALTAGEKKEGLLNDARVVAGLKEIPASALVLMARPATLAAWLRGEGPWGRMPSDAQAASVPGGPGGPFAVQFGVVGGVGPQGPQAQAVLPLPPPPGANQPPPAGRVADPAPAKKVDDELSPLVLGLNRKADQVVIEGRFLEPKVGLAKLVDKLIEQAAPAPAVPAGFGAFPGQAQFVPAVPPAQPAQPAKVVPMPAQVPPPPKDK